MRRGQSGRGSQKDKAMITFLENSYARNRMLLRWLFVRHVAFGGGGEEG